MTPEERVRIKYLLNQIDKETEMMEQAKGNRSPQPLAEGESVRIGCGAVLSLRGAVGEHAGSVNEVLFDASNCGGAWATEESTGRRLLASSMSILFYNESLPGVINFLRRVAATIGINVD